VTGPQPLPTGSTVQITLERFDVVLANVAAVDVAHEDAREPVELPADTARGIRRKRPAF